MDTDLLKTFIDLTRTRHFSRSAENLFLTQAAVSARIKLLEQKLGAELFTRHRNNLQLTPHGLRLLPHAESIVLAWERAQLDLGFSGEEGEFLSLASTNGLWDVCLSHTLNTIKQKLPKLTLRAEALQPSVLSSRLIERNLDVSLSIDPPKHSDIYAGNFTQLELILVSTRPPDNHDLNAVLSNYTAIDWGNAFENTIAKHLSLSLRPVFHTNLAKIGMEYIVACGGSAYLPKAMVMPYIGQRLWRVESAPIIQRTVYYCYHKGSDKELEIELLVDIFKEEQHAQLSTDCDETKIIEL